MRVIAFLIGVVCLTYAAPSYKPDHKGALQWLVRFNYIDKEDVANAIKQNITDKEIEKEPLSVLKTIYNLGSGGDLNEETQNFMSQRRCGNPDKPYNLLHRRTNNSLARKKRFAVIPGVPIWTTPGFGFSLPITIGFNNYTSRMTRAAQDAALLHCATRWAEESGLSFEILENQVANIYIGFVDALENQAILGDVLAEADSPTPFRNPGSSNIDLDNRFSWVPRFEPNQPDNVASFQGTLCHEMGHSLGLDHSEDENAIMFAVTTQRDFERDLDEDDIAGIRSLYGEPNDLVIVNRPAPPSPPAPVTTPAPAPELTPTTSFFPSTTSSTTFKPKKSVKPIRPSKRRRGSNRRGSNRRRGNRGRNGKGRNTFSKRVKKGKRKPCKFSQRGCRNLKKVAKIRNKRKKRSRSRS